MFALLTLKNNLVSVVTSLLVALFFLVNLAVAQPDVSNKLNFHGFVSQGLIQAKDTNFVNDSGDISAELTEVGLNLSYQLSDGIRLTGQAVYLDGGNRYNKGLRVDYALLDWSVYNTQSWKINAYIGRFKNYHWLYSSIRNVPMSRPSIVLPQSVYFDATRDMSVGGDGAAISAKYNSDIIGDLDVNLSSGTTRVARSQTEFILGSIAQGKIKHQDDLQASLYWQPPLSAWRFGLALTDASFDYSRGKLDLSPFNSGQFKNTRYYANASYQGESWSLSAELLQEEVQANNILPIPTNIDRVGHGGFLQGVYLVREDFKLTGRYERFYADKEDKLGKKLEAQSQFSPFGVIPSYFAYQNDTMLGITYDVTDYVQLQAEHHWYQGAARLTPLFIPNTRLNHQKNWQLSAIQLTYWF